MLNFHLSCYECSVSLHVSRVQFVPKAEVLSSELVWQSVDKWLYWSLTSIPPLCPRYSWSKTDWHVDSVCRNTVSGMPRHSLQSFTNRNISIVSVILFPVFCFSASYFIFHYVRYSVCNSIWYFLCYFVDAYDMNTMASIFPNEYE